MSKFPYPLNWHETTLGDIEGLELSERFFGEIDVPILEQLEDDIPAFDNTRNNLLNRANPRVVTLIAWISHELEKERLLLVQEEREKRKTEQALKLEREAQKMANILNEDFKNLMMELEVTKKISGSNKQTKVDGNLDEGEILPGKGDENSNWDESGWPYGNGTGHRGQNPPGQGDFPRPGPSVIPGNSLGSPQQESNGGSRKTKSGIFRIECKHLSEDYVRSEYRRDEHLILINLDHPQIALALKEGGGSLESRHFLSTVYEIAIVEYAQAIPYEKLQLGEQVDAADALFSVGETIERISRKLPLIFAD